MRNEFARALLNYSAERDDSIGRPERWGDPPPLVVSDTPLHAEMAALATELWERPPHVIWYFLIGGPGNGKSEAVGAFVRQLNILAQKDGAPPVFDAAKGHDGGSISYWFVEKIPQGEIALLQDISVPKSVGSDPALNVLETITLCAESAAHILVCANRGMLLRATRVARSSPEFGWLLPILQNIDKQSQETAIARDARWNIQHRDRKVEIRVWPLDHESILHGNGSNNPWADASGSLLDQITAKAVAKEKWEAAACDGCAAQDLCPMLGDARWLRDDNRRQGFLKLLRYGEIWSGQRIVMREALGLLSTVLVGTPSDFVESGAEMHPCDWVAQRISGAPAKAKNEVALIELISHRLYQDLFGRMAPSGLILAREQGQRDKWVYEKLKTLQPVGERVAAALGNVDRNFAKQSGPLRLIGSGGILEDFDPAKDNSWCFKYSLPVDGQISDLRKLGETCQTGLETAFADILQVLEDSAKSLPAHKDPAKVFAALYRWASTIFTRIAGTALGETLNSESLSDYLNLLQHPLRPLPGTAGQTTLGDLMQSVAGTENRVKLAPSFFVSLGSLKLRPTGARARSDSPRWPANDRLGLDVFTSSTDRSSVLLTARTFVDAWRKHVTHVAEWNISPAMEQLMEAWRNDFTVTRGHYRNLQAVEFDDDPPLKFEFLSETEIQVRER